MTLRKPTAAKLGAPSSDLLVPESAASTVTVVCQAAVHVLVDVDGRQVRRVVVDDRSISAPGYALPPLATRDEVDRHERALEIADDAAWPSWELGW